MLFRCFCVSVVAAACALPSAWGVEDPPPAKPIPEKIAIAPGPFQPTYESLGKYQCPEWFRDAKLGIWGIIGPQSVPEAGDWYARNLYIEGSGQYKHHLEHYGHPSQVGYKDLLPLWKMDGFDPERLMGLYKKAGAKYFVVLANHHDNFDCWNSTYHRWNSVNCGPKKDITGLWAAAARKQGLRFGVTEHLARSWSWFNTNKGADKAGPKAGVPYDGADPKYVDLYFPPHADTRANYPENAPESWTREWFYRTRDLLDSYQPDLMYSDGGVPFGEVGRSLMAHFYNANVQRHGGKLEAVYTIKDMGGHGEYRDDIGVQDVERGALRAIKQRPWQTDTCIGDWYYKKGMRYKSPRMVVAMLADIVSKNGNLLLNIPLRSDGTIDAEEEKFLEGLGAWMALYGEAIYGTRPWALYGEGPHNTSDGHFNEGQFNAMTAADIRFTTSGKSLYAIALGWPEDGKITVKALAKTAGGNAIEAVELVGAPGKLAFVQEETGLVVTLPATKGYDGACALKITGTNLRPAKP